MVVTREEIEQAAQRLYGPASKKRPSVSQCKTLGRTGFYSQLALLLVNELREDEIDLAKTLAVLGTAMEMAMEVGYEIARQEQRAIQ